MTKKKKDLHYVDKKELYDQIKEYKDRCKKLESEGKPKPIIPDTIGKAIIDIAEGTASRPNFSGYIFRDEMVADGIENAIKAVDSFDPDVGNNPFGYFSQVIWYAYLRRIDKEKTDMYIRYKCSENAMIHGMLVDNSGEGDYNRKIDLDNDYMTEFVKDFEKKKAEKLAKARENSRAKNKKSD